MSTVTNTLPGSPLNITGPVKAPTNGDMKGGPMPNVTIPDPSATVMRKLLLDKEVKYVRNQDGPRLAYVEIQRNVESGEPVAFITHYELNNFIEKIDDRSVLAKHTSPKWVALKEEDVKKINEEVNKKYGRVTEPVVGIDMAKGKDETVKTVVEKSPEPKKEDKK